MPELLERVSSALAGRYRISHTVGAGGMAVVFRAEDLKHGRPVAIKILKPELASAHWSSRFLREIQIASRLQHPSILALYDSGEAQGFLYARTVAALVGSQYYWVLHAHPVALLGYATVVEGSPVKLEALEYLTKAGIPREALRTLYLHAELDIDHGAEAGRFLDSLPLTVEQFRLIGLSAMHSVEQLSMMIDELVQSPQTG